jgi:hypothetical protein
VEARNVETRKDMRKDERRVKRPWETQDVPDNEQIVRFYGEGPQDVFVPVKDEAAIGRPVRPRTVVWSGACSAGSPTTAY